MIDKLPGFRKIHNRRAQGMVEFALALPIVLLLVFGIIEGARLLFIYSSVTLASREAARFGAGAEHHTDCGGITNRAIQMGFVAGVTNSNVTVTYDYPPQGMTAGPTPTPYANCNSGVGVVMLGSRVLVQVSVPYRPIVPLVNFPGMTIISKNSHTIVTNVTIPTPTPSP